MRKGQRITKPYRERLSKDNAIKRQEQFIELLEDERAQLKELFLTEVRGKRMTFSWDDYYKIYGYYQKQLGAYGSAIYIAKRKLKILNMLHSKDSAPMANLKELIRSVKRIGTV